MRSQTETVLLCMIAGAAGLARPSRLGFWWFQLLRAVFVQSERPTFLASLDSGCDTFWGADGHLAALLGACSYGLAANRTSVFITGAPGSGKTRSCAFLGVLLACLTSRLTLYTAHGNESVRAYVEAVDRLTTASNEFVRSRIVRIPGNKEKDTHKLPFDVHDLYRGLLVAQRRVRKAGPTASAKMLARVLGSCSLLNESWDRRRHSACHSAGVRASSWPGSGESGSVANTPLSSVGVHSLR